MRIFLLFRHYISQLGKILVPLAVDHQKFFVKSVALRVRHGDGFHFMDERNLPVSAPQTAGIGGQSRRAERSGILVYIRF